MFHGSALSNHRSGGVGRRFVDDWRGRCSRRDCTPPLNAQAYYERGLDHFNRGRTDHAIADFNQAIKLDPNFAKAYLQRGVGYLDKVNIDSAMADFNQAIKLDPNFATANFNRGVLYFIKFDFDRAITDYSQATKLNPKYAKAYMYRAVAYHRKGDNDRAIADRDRAIKIDSKIVHDAAGLDKRFEMIQNSLAQSSVAPSQKTHAQSSLIGVPPQYQKDKDAYFQAL